MTTNWQIYDTKYQVADGLITQVTYGCTVALGKFIDRTTGTLQLVGGSSTEGFIPYSDLTQEIVVGWVKSLLGTAGVSSIETPLRNNVTAQKAAQEAETVKNGLPWR
jgi:hypothetical protein